MIASVITAVLSFVSTDIDELLVLMFLFSQAADKKDGLRIVAGKYIGMFILLAISLLGAFGLNFLPEKYVSLLGIVPIALGVKGFIDLARGVDDDDETDGIKGVGVFAVVALTVSGGADNIGVYVPLFTGYSVAEILVTVAIFAVLTLLWCFLGKRLASLPIIGKLIEKYKNILVPTVFILLGIYIILEGWL